MASLVERATVTCCTISGINISLADEMSNATRQEGSVDTVAAQSCTRSGTFALLLSLALFAMAPYWLIRPNERALANYQVLRLNLLAAVDQLHESPNWKIYKSINGSADLLTIGQLLTVRLETPPQTATTETKPTNSALPSKKKNSSNIMPPKYMPGPVTNLRVRTGITEIFELADLLAKLNDSDMLTKSRGVSTFDDYSIYRWVLKRNSMLARTLSAKAGNTVVVEGEITDGRSLPLGYVPPLDTKEMLQCLTLQDVTELAKFQLPTVSDTAKLGPHGEREIEVTPGSLPRALYPATVCAQLLVLLTLIYFNAFVREAVSSDSFPLMGTLFSAFAKSRWTLAAFLLCLYVPLFASLTLSVLSLAWPVAVITIPVSCAIVSTHQLLNRRSYFRPLNPFAHALTA